MMCKNKFYSETITNLQNEIQNGNEDALQSFWNKIEVSGTPIIENIEGDDENALITYIYKGDEKTENVIVMHPTCWKDYKDNMLINIPNTDVWYKSYAIRNDVRGRYDFSVNDSLDEDWEKRDNNISYDKYNDNKIIFKDEEGNVESMVSYFEMPKATEYKWTIERDTTNKGSLEAHDLYFKGLKDKRKIYVYKPYNYSPDNVYKLLVLTDGDIYLDVLSAKNVFDNLIEEGAIQPIIIILIDGGENRNEELTCDETFADCLALEMMNWIRTNFNVSDRAEDTIIGGFSLGGLFSAFMGLKYPNIFGNVFSQSGSFFWRPNEEEEINWILKKYKEAEKFPAKFFLNVGVLENMDYPPYSSMRDVNKEMRDILAQKDGCIVKYEEFNSGHDYLSWGETLSNALIFLLAN